MDEKVEMDRGGFGWNEMRHSKKQVSLENIKEKKWELRSSTKAAWKVGNIQEEEPNEELGKLHKR